MAAVTPAPEDYEEPFALWFRRKLAEQNLKQRRVVHVIGASTGMLSNWTGGRRVPSPENCGKLAALLGVPEEEVLTRAGYRQRRDTDPDPRRAELLELARQVPLSDAELIAGFMRWRLSESHRPRHRAPEAGQ